MNIRMNTRQDYSLLFSSLNNSNSANSKGSNSFNEINLADYASIKSGSYGKLLKAYYKKDNTDGSTGTDSISSVNKTKVDATVKKELTDIQFYANEVQNSAETLMEKGGKSVFKDGNKEKIYQDVADFASNYNTLMEKSQNSSSSSVARSANSMANRVKGSADLLKEVGITIGQDKKLSVNKDTFMNADMNKVKSLFNGSGSLSEQVFSKASEIGNKAYSESNKSNLYTGNGTYSGLSTGDLYSGMV
ncbi:MAG: hypothetical protein ACI4D2_02330 [Lachnospiraceae bacterium]